MRVYLLIPGSISSNALNFLVLFCVKKRRICYSSIPRIQEKVQLGATLLEHVYEGVVYNVALFFSDFIWLSLYVGYDFWVIYGKIFMNFERLNSRTRNMWLDLMMAWVWIWIISTFVGAWCDDFWPMFALWIISGTLVLVFWSYRLFLALIKHWCCQFSSFDRFSHCVCAL